MQLSRAGIVCGLAETGCGCLCPSYNNEDDIAALARALG